MANGSEETAKDIYVKLDYRERWKPGRVRRVNVNDPKSQEMAIEPWWQQPVVAMMRSNRNQK